MKGSNGCFQRDLRARQSSAFWPPWFSLGLFSKVFTRLFFEGFHSAYFRGFSLCFFSMVLTRPIWDDFHSAYLQGRLFTPIISFLASMVFTQLFLWFSLGLIAKVFTRPIHQDTLYVWEHQSFIYFLVFTF